MRGLEFYRTAHFLVCIHINSFTQLFEHFHVKETALDVWDASLNKTNKQKKFLPPWSLWAQLESERAATYFFPRDSIISNHHREPVCWIILISTCHRYYYLIYLFGCAGF